MQKNSINYGIISTASIVPRFVNGIKESCNGNVIAISSRSLEKAEAMGRELEIPEFYDDYQVLIKDPRIDCIYIPLVNNLHYPFAFEALTNDKNVILEKPFVLHEKDGLELKRIAYERNLFITEAVKTPFLPVFQDVKELIDSKELGNIHIMSFRQSYSGNNYSQGWNRIKESGGGALYGNEAYFLTMAEYHAGKIKSYSALATFRDEYAESQFTASLLLQNGVLATCTVSSETLLNNGLTIYLDKGRIEIPDYWKASAAYVYEGNELIRKIEYPCRYEMKYEIKHFNDCMLNNMNESPVIPLDDSIRHIRICEDLYEQWSGKHD